MTHARRWVQMSKSLPYRVPSKTTLILYIFYCVATMYGCPIHTMKGRISIWASPNLSHFHLKPRTHKTQIISKITGSCLFTQSFRVSHGPGNTNWRGRHSTIDLPIEVACFVTKVKEQGGQLYWAFPFSKASLNEPSCWKIMVKWIIMHAHFLLLETDFKEL